MKKLNRKSDTYNALDSIPKDSGAIAASMDIADALVVQTGEEREPHWNESAITYIGGATAATVQYGRPEAGTRSLQDVARILSHGGQTDMVTKLMLESDAWDGALARLGGQMGNFVEKERASVLTTVSRHLRFLSIPEVMENTRTSSYDPKAEFRNGRVSVYFVVPFEHLRAAGISLLRLWISSHFRAIMRNGPQEIRLVHGIIDEAGQLGRLQATEDALTIGAGYGLRLQLYYQSAGQLQKCFPNGADQTLKSNTTAVYFGVADLQTATEVSNRCGQGTIVVQSGGSQRGGSDQTSSGARDTSHSRGTSWGQNSNWAQQGRHLLRPEEVLTLPRDIALTFVPGLPPIATRLIKYYQEKWLYARPGRFARFRAAAGALCLSATLLIVTAACAWFLTQFALDASRRGVVFQGRNDVDTFGRPVRVQEPTSFKPWPDK